MVIHHGDGDGDGDGDGTSGYHSYGDTPPKPPFLYFDLPCPPSGGGDTPARRSGYCCVPFFTGEPGPPAGRGTVTLLGLAPLFPYGSAPPLAAQTYWSPFAALAPSAFPPGTDPNVQAADADGNVFIDDKALQRALSSYDQNQRFSLRTVHLMMYLFTSSSNFRRIGPKEFISVFNSLQRWRAIFERFDRDRSGRIDMTGLQGALLSLRFDVSPTTLDLLVSKFDNCGGKNKSIDYDQFIECCLTVKGLKEKFDKMYTGSATFTFESFMMSVLPFLIA